jgi:multiple sugar transport system ATP-binding protein
MNLLECRIDSAGERLRGAIDYPAPEGLAAAARRAREESVTVGVRPEAIAADGDPATAGSAAGYGFPARVDVVEPVGERSLLYVSLDAGPELTLAVPGATDLGEGASLRVRIPPERVHLFDGATGAALHHPDPTAVEAAVAGGDGGDRGNRDGRDDRGDG